MTQLGGVLDRLLAGPGDEPVPAVCHHEVRLFAEEGTEPGQTGLQHRPQSRIKDLGHYLVERIEAEIRRVLSDVTVSTHLEPIDDPISFHEDCQDRPNEISEP